MRRFLSRSRRVDAGMEERKIKIRGAAQNNLRGLDVDLPQGRLVGISGVSGSGKTSLAFDTLYAEARRRFWAAADRQTGSLWGRLPPPRVDSIEGLPPAVALGQERARQNPRSTVATLCGLYDYLRLLFARMGQAHCLGCGAPVEAQRFEEVWESAAGLPEGTRLAVLAPWHRQEGDERDIIAAIDSSGYRRVRVDGREVLLDELQEGALANGVLEVVVDRLVIKPGTAQRLRGSLQAALEVGRGQVVLAPLDGLEQKRFAVQPSCSACGLPFGEVHTALFSFNSPQGACRGCRGLGVHSGVELDSLFEGGRLTLEEALGPLWRTFGHEDIEAKLSRFCRRHEVDLETPLSQWPAAAPAALWDGDKRRGGFVGLRRSLERLRGKAAGEELAFFDTLLGDVPCSDCHGRRLSPEALAVEVDGASIAAWSALSLKAFGARLDALKWDGPQAAMGAAVVAQIAAGVEVLVGLGLGYLTLDRRADSLSSGELQRLRLAAILGLRMTHMLYVLDEPSAGLHARDTERLAEVLERLRDAGNTLAVVEHDASLLGRCDHIVDIGPGAGVQGGRLVGEGAPEALAGGEGLTGRYLAGRLRLPAGQGQRPGAGGWLCVEGASGHNLKGIDVALPLGNLVCVTGVSGSGKSSLVQETLRPLVAAHLQRAEKAPLPYAACRGLEHIERVVAVDQRPIGRSSRSNAATYTGLMQELRRLFCEVPEARMRGWGPGHFSFNAVAGACQECKGSGVEQLQRGVVGEVEVACGVCGGRRYRPEVLEVRYGGHSIADVLDMDVTQACQAFAPVPDLARRLGLLDEVGLGYLRLGQPATSLSGGEAQRVKLAAELGRPQRAHTLYLLDEPTTGLHLEDVRFLLELLRRLVAEQNTVVVVEHHIELIAAADYVVDLGPEGGDGGGQVVAAGTPVEVATVEGSHTGYFLRRVLAGK